MKRKSLYVLLFVGVFFTLLCSVGALTAKAPSTIPSEGTHLYATVDDDFDFSKIEFTPSEGTTNIKGKENLRKIRLSTTYTTSENKIVLGDDWFTAYCLDQTVGYPEDGIIYGLLNQISGENLFKRAVLTAIKNNANSSKNMYNLIATLKNHIFSSIEYEVPDEYKDGETIKYDDMTTALYTDSNTKIKVQIKKIVYASNVGNVVEITGSQLNEAIGKTGENYEIELQRDNIVFNRYVTTNMDSSKNYNWALWIIEHSYPTLTLDRLFEDVNVSRDQLEQEIVTLANISGDDKNEVEKYLENYVYATIQYAIWHVTGSKINGITLGNELIGSEELNKIYQYFILDRGYTNYGSEDFKTELNVNKPSVKGEIAEENSTSVKYGPYSITSKMISVGDINLGTAGEEGVSIVGTDGEEISSVKVDEKFYILVNKDSKISDITISAATDNGYNFVPASNRGRVYYAHDPLTQTVGTGGIIKKVNASTSFKIAAKTETEKIDNPKTGISSIATVFILSLILFSLVYLLISYKNKPVEL